MTKQRTDQAYPPSAAHCFAVSQVNVFAKAPEVMERARRVPLGSVHFIEETIDVKLIYLSDPQEQIQ